MVHFLLITFIVQGLAMTPVKVEISGPFTKKECSEMVKAESKVFPISDNGDARWQTGICAELLSISEPAPILEKWSY